MASSDQKASTSTPFHPILFPSLFSSDGHFVVCPTTTYSFDLCGVHFIFPAVSLSFSSLNGIPSTLGSFWCPFSTKTECPLQPSPFSFSLRTESCRRIFIFSTHRPPSFNLRPQQRERMLRWTTAVYSYDKVVEKYRIIDSYLSP